MKRKVALAIVVLGVFVMPISVSAEFQVKGCSKKTAVHFDAEQPYAFCYKSDALLVPMMPSEADIKEMGVDGSPSSTIAITYYKGGDSPQKVMAWMSENFRGRAVQGKTLKTRKGVVGFYYDWYQTEGHGGRLIEHGAFLINKKSQDNEFVKIAFVPNPKDKAFKTLMDTFRFTGSGIVNGQPYVPPVK